jgi:branched-chain amino acid transport system substrate-binding protein
MKAVARTLLAMVLLVLGPTACQREEPLRLGFLGSLTGGGATLGVPARDGFLLAVEQRNAAGGVGGRPVEVLIRDDAKGGESARAAVRELLEAKVAAIVGPELSAIAMATVDLVNAAKVPMVSPTVTTSELSGKDDYFFRVTSDAAEYAATAARFHYERMGRRRIVVAQETTNKAYSGSWLAAFRREFERLGGTIVSVTGFESGPSAGLEAVAATLATAKADAALVIAGAVDAASLCQLVRARSATLPLFTSEWAAASEQFIELGGRALEGVHVAQFLKSEDRSPRYVAFVTAYRERYRREPGFAAVAAYDAATVALDALARRKPGEDFKATLLANPRYEGLQGPIAFDAFGEARRSTHIHVIRDGRFVPAE